MKRLLLLFCFLGLLCSVRGQTKIHYWFDSQTDQRVAVPANDNPHLVTDIDVSALSDGVHTLFVQAEDKKGRLSAPIGRMFLRPCSIDGRKFYRCSFDNKETDIQTGELGNGPVMLDVSALSDGLHTVQVQAYGDWGLTASDSYLFLKVPKTVGNEKITYICLIDEQKFEQRTVSGTQDVIHIDLDVAPLAQGVHKLQVILDLESGAVSSAYTTYFYRTLLESEVEATQVVYNVDGRTMPVTPATTSNGGIMHFDLDVSSFSNGLHCINYALVGKNGVYANGNPAWFYKIPEGGEGIVSYEYWLNDDEAHARHTDLEKHYSTYELVSLLPVDVVPIRSSLFQFAYKKDTIPVVYAKNDFHVRFWESGGSFALAQAQYVDERVCDTVKADTLREKNMFARPATDGIKWFKVPVRSGDSLSFKANTACTMQLFSPSAAELYTADAQGSLQWDGAHVFEDGVCYLAVHDVTSPTATNVTVEYQHINRYAVLRQDVNRVGNGGFSTITFEGNGMDSLLSVYLVNASGDVINGESIGHESNTKTSVAFDFTDVTLGEYDAVFEFAEEEEIYLDENVVVEEPVDIVLTSSVDYPSTYLEGETVTYTLTITNEGNMSAYNVPIYVYIGTPTYNSISYLKFNGLNLPSIIDGINQDSLDINSLYELQKWSEKIGDDHYFLKFRALDSISGDSIWIRSNYFFSTIAPYETKKMSLTIAATDYVDVWFSIYDTMIPLLDQTKNPKGKRFINAELLESKEGLCCVKEQVECTMDLVCHGLDRASILIMDGALAGAIVGLGTLNPVIIDGAVFLFSVSELSGAASCMCSAFSTGTKIIGNISCDDNDGSSVYEKIKSALVNNNKSLEKTLFNCLLQTLNPVGSAYSAANHWNEVYEASKLGTIYALNAYMHGGNGENNQVYDCISKYHKVPDCFPRHPKGGKSTPVDPSDPNEIRGFMSESGSRYMPQETETIHYEIEFENDTLFATAPAHTIIVRDTLDAGRFDLASFAMTRIKIGDKSMEWTAGQKGTQTLDMRTRMNVVAQVELDYDADKGIAVWTVTSLDPMTMQPIQEADLGVLPVNWDGNGKGIISYRVRLKDRFADGTQVSNSASIVFDNNSAIPTPVWTNTVDAVRPTSQIVSAIVTDGGIDFTIKAEDSRSKVWYTTVYARQDTESQWEAAGKTYDSSLNLQLQNGWTQFYAQATDSAGNVESKNNVVEYSLAEGVSRYYTLYVTCNPLQGTVTGNGVYAEGTEATVSATSKPGYKFTKWSDGNEEQSRTVVMNGNVELQALFEAVTERYVITFYDEDGTTVLDSREWEYGALPSCKEPVKEEDALYSYTFSNWIPEIAVVTQSASYTATYLAVPKTTSLESETADKTTMPRKVLIDGILYIELPDGTRFTVQGTRVK